MAVETMKQEAQRLLSDVPAENVFWVNDGCILHNMKELADEIKNMSDDAFFYHANGEKNDFITWVRDVIKDETLVRELRKSSTKTQSAKAVANRINILSKRMS
jgi:hypothetical protein